MSDGTTQVVVCGGGITGLTVAYRLLRALEGRVRVTVVEASDRLGGSLVTLRRDGLVLDGGADAFVASKPQAKELCRELGIAERLQETDARHRHVYFMRRGRLVRLPEGMVLAVPTRFWPLVKSPLFSVVGKARMGLDLLAPRRHDDGDESIASFLGRRLGAEAVEVFGEPLLAGIFSGDPTRLSIQATFPQLVDLERNHRSLVVGALAQRSKAPAPKNGRAPSAFLALRGGMGELVETLSERLRILGCEIVKGAAVSAVRRDRAGFRVTVRHADREETLVANRVVFASPAAAIARAIDDLDPEAARELRRIPHVSTASLLLAYPRAAVPHALDASGILIPRREGHDASAVTFMSSKWEGRAPDDVALLRVFLGGHARPEVRGMTNDDLVEIAKAELRSTLGITVDPLTAETFRWSDARPQPVIGHLDRVRAIRSRLAKHGGLYAAGAPFDGVGISDCVRQANEVVNEVVRSLSD
ncbi:MAG: protoporphyrinogen oxidase [Polyangiaceae bacterium]|nr:protoporphyrinogen oxidase [Polyangiaceae bacterium]